MLTFAIDWRVGGGEAWSFQLSNILLHAICVLVIFWVVRARWSHGVAAACAALFAVLALHTENVAGIVARADILATIFGLLTWHVAGKKGLKTPLWAGLLMLASLLSKEIGIAFLGLVVAEEVLGLRPENRDRRARLLVIAAMAVAVAIYLALRISAIETVAAPVNPQSNPLVRADGADQQLWTASANLTRTVRLFLVPAELAADYSYAEIMPYPSPWSGDVLAGLGLWLLLPAAVLVFRRRAPGVSSGLLLFLAAYVPVSNLLLLVPTIFAERLLYLASLGLVLAGVLAAARLWKQPRRRAALLAAVAVLVTAHSARSAFRAHDWRSARALFSSAVEIAPGSARNWFNLGVADLDHDQPTEAIEHLQESLRILPNQAQAYSFIGVGLDQLDRPKDAHVEMYRATRIEPGCRLCAINLVNLYTKYGFFADARSEIERYRKSSGNEPEALRMLTNLQAVEDRAKELGEKPRPRLFQR
ncbi:MAG: hypothetical protein KJO07_08585 [Deltaproteobacteria bacterium]|nr:hypothetical protein [Deltaproteobacteria bacterium]